MDADERMQILRMVEARQITAEEGVRLLQALDRAASADRPKDEPSQSARWLRVHVTDVASGKEKVNIRVPLSLVPVGMRLGARFAPDLDPQQSEEFLRAIREGAQGRILDVQDSRTGERVEIWVE